MGGGSRRGLGGGAPGGSVGGGGSRWGDLGCWGGWRGGAQAPPLTSPCPPSNHTITIKPTSLAMPAMLIGLNKIPQISFLLPHHCSPFWTPTLTLTLA